MSPATPTTTAVGETSVEASMTPTTTAAGETSVEASTTATQRRKRKRKNSVPPTPLSEDAVGLQVASSALAQPTNAMPAALQQADEDMEPKYTKLFASLLRIEEGCEAMEKLMKRNHGDIGELVRCHEELRDDILKELADFDAKFHNLMAEIALD